MGYPCIIIPRTIQKNLTEKRGNDSVLGSTWEGLMLLWVSSMGEWGLSLITLVGNWETAESHRDNWQLNPGPHKKQFSPVSATPFWGLTGGKKSL